MKDYEKQMFEFIDKIKKIDYNDKRQTVLLLGLYGEYIVNELLKIDFFESELELEKINSQEIKLKILRATRILSCDEYSVLILLNQIRNKYAHNLEIDEKKIDGLMRQIKINFAGEEKKIKEFEERLNKIPFTKFQSGCIAKIIYLFQKLEKFGKLNFKE